MKEKEDKKEDRKEDNTNRIRNDIIIDIRQNLGLEPNDKSMDDNINRMSLNEIFDRWCEWNGLINYGGKLRYVVSSIYGVDLNRINKKGN